MFEVVIERPAGAGLGMSISGGIDRPYVVRAPERPKKGPLLQATAAD